MRGRARHQHEARGDQGYHSPLQHHPLSVEVYAGVPRDRTSPNIHGASRSSGVTGIQDHQGAPRAQTRDDLVQLIIGDVAHVAGPAILRHDRLVQPVIFLIAVQIRDL